jgi:hypothetical protein
VSDSAGTRHDGGPGFLVDAARGKASARCSSPVPGSSQRAATKAVVSSGDGHLALIAPDRSLAALGRNQRGRLDGHRDGAGPAEFLFKRAWRWHPISCSGNGSRLTGQRTWSAHEPARRPRLRPQPDTRFETRVSGWPEHARTTANSRRCQGTAHPAATRRASVSLTPFPGPASACHSERAPKRMLGTRSTPGTTTTTTTQATASPIERRPGAPDNRH